jgi:hypothetical protein
VKKTWKFGALPVEAASIVASAGSYTAAALALGVDRSTVFRWQKAGKIPRPGGRRRHRPVAAVVDGPPSPDQWAAWARQTFALSPTEDVLLAMAEGARTLAADLTQAPLVRLNAAGRFQQLVRQLNFEEETDGQATHPADRPRYPRPRLA